MEIRNPFDRVLVACPDARPPAYQAVIGLNRAALLGSFVTATYYNPNGQWAELARLISPDRFTNLERSLLRRHDAEIPSERVRANPSFDIAIRLESRFATRLPGVKRALAEWRTRRFDDRLAQIVTKTRPRALLAFSDVASDRTLPTCQRLGIPTILSMVHGDVREEQTVLEQEAEISPEFLSIYLGSGRLDRQELDWLHERRLRELELAERIAVPSDHIANTLMRYGTSRDRIQVIPYAADCARFHPMTGKHHGSSCTFLFAGGISQRKGIKYLLQAWKLIRRPGWKLQLLGPLPGDTSPLLPYLDSVELLGRVSHSQMPGLMAQADVFVFPSLFEGSAVVTYEALASGLPSVVTPQSGSVVREGIEGYLVGPRDVRSLAARMEQLGCDPSLREQMSTAARKRALAFDWPRYHSALISLVKGLQNESTSVGGSRISDCPSEHQRFEYACPVH